MNVEMELLWPGAALLLLLLLGAVVGLCVRCSHPGVKRAEKIYEQRNQRERDQNFVVARTYSLANPTWPGSLTDTASDMSSTRKDRLMRFSHLEGPESPRYQNFCKGSRCEPDEAYVDPITMDRYKWRHSQKPLEEELADCTVRGPHRWSGKEDDSISYENVLICRPSTPQSDVEDSEDYQNSASIHQWRESRRAVEQVFKGAHLSPSGSPDEDTGEPDYVNGDVAAARKI